MSANEFKLTDTVPADEVDRRVGHHGPRPGDVGYDYADELVDAAHSRRMVPHSNRPDACAVQARHRVARTNPVPLAAVPHWGDDPFSGIPNADDEENEKMQMPNVDETNQQQALPLVVGSRPPGPSMILRSRGAGNSAPVTAQDRPQGVEPRELDKYAGSPFGDFRDFLASLGQDSAAIGTTGAEEPGSPQPSKVAAMTSAKSGEVSSSVAGAMRP